ncbi:MAG: Ig-like domain-containing protein [Gemmatimonadaceae bacterium]
MKNISTNQPTRARAGVLRIAAALMLSAASLTVTSCGGGDNGVTDPPVVVISRIDVTASTATLATAQTLSLNAVARSAAGAVVASPSLTWTSSASGVATVNGSGTVTAVAPGTVTISAASGAVSGTVALTVVAAGGIVVTVAVQLSDATLQLGALGQAVASARDANNQVVAIGTRPLTWTSTNANVATVSLAGVITAVGIGTSTFRAAVTEGSNTVAGTSSTLTVVANPDAKASVDVSMPGLTFSPSDIVVKLNGTVRFIFPPADHNVFWNAGQIGAPANINTIQSVTISRTFSTVGVFPFVCTLHNGMVGTVVVSP